MPTDFVFPSATPPVAASAQQVWIRARWSDAWIAKPDLHCTRLSLATGETMSQASFYWRFGAGRLPGDTGFVARPVVAVAPHAFVKVAFDGVDGRDGVTWCGTWQRATKAQTHQTFGASGLESTLNVPCLDMPYEKLNGSVEWANTGLEFDLDFLPNRSQVKREVNGQEVYVFTEDQQYAQYWSTRDAVELLAAVSSPVDGSGNLLWVWDLINLETLPDWDKVFRTPTHGRTFLDLFRSLISRSRGVCWGCSLGNIDGLDVPQIWIDSFASQAFDVVDSAGDVVGTIPENSDQITLDCSEDQSASSSMSIESQHLADQVVVTGAPRQIVCSLSYRDGSLDRDWTDTDLDAYKAGASGDPDYPGASEVSDRERINRQARNSDALRAVFARFRVPAEWSQQVCDGEGGTEGRSPAPLATVDDSDPVEPFHFYEPMLQFVECLPLRAGYDHTKDAIANLDGYPGYRGLPIEGAETHDELPILLIVQTKPADNGELAKWVNASELGRAADIELEEDDTATTWSAVAKRLKTVPRKAAIQVHVDGAERHILGATDLAGEDMRIPGDVSWQDMILTVSFYDLRDAEARWPADEDLDPIADQVSVLRIQATGYCAIYVQPNTVVGVDDKNGLLLRTNGGWLIDERDQLLLIAQRAYCWYRTPRYALQLSTAWIDGGIQVGQLVTEVTDTAGTWPVNSVVTEITYEFPVSEGSTPAIPRMTLTTAFAELDVTALTK